MSSLERTTDTGRNHLKLIAENGELLHPEPFRTIYLDLDGVILPYWHKSDGGFVMPDVPNGPLVRRTDIQAGLTEQWIDRNEFYYPEIVQRIGAIAARGATVLPSSSRSFDMYFYHGYSPILDGIGHPEGYLVIDTERPAHIGYKAEAVLNNFQGIADIGREHRGYVRRSSGTQREPGAKPANHRAVWIDDHAVSESVRRYGSERAVEILNQSRLHIVTPIGSIGITMDQLDEAEAFLFEGGNS